MRHLRFTLWLLLALGVALAAACVGSVFWPVRVYELFEVAQGPYAPGYPGKAYLPSERAPNVAEMQARLQIAIPALVGAAALILAWRVARRTVRGQRLMTLEDWNTAGLDRREPDFTPRTAQTPTQTQISPPTQGG